MIVTAWNNGGHHASGAGYGVRVKPHDRDVYFRPDWSEVLIELPDESLVAVSIDKDSFWGEKCRELIKQEIGVWLLNAKLAPWPKGKPPKLDLEPLSQNQFRLSK